MADTQLTSAIEPGEAPKVEEPPLDPWSNLQRQGSIKVEGTYNPQKSLARSQARARQPQIQVQGPPILTPEQQARQQRELMRQNAIIASVPQDPATLDLARAESAKKKFTNLILGEGLFLAIYGSNLWMKEKEAGSARLVLMEKDSNPNMIQFADYVLYYWAFYIFYAFANFMLLQMGKKAGQPGKYLHHAKWCDLFQAIPQIGLMSYGIHYSWTQDQRDMREPFLNPDNQECEAAKVIKTYIDGMIVLVGMIQLCFLVLLCACVMCLVILKGHEVVTNNQHFQNRVPQAQKLIAARGKKYDPKDPDMKEGCVICLEDFSETDQKRVAQLKCNHIFHEECLKEWVTKNDVCPMCRAPIKDESDPFAN